MHSQNSRSDILTEQLICILTELSQNSRSYALAELSVRYTHRTTLDPKHSNNSRYDTFDILTELSMRYTQRAPRVDILTAFSIYIQNSRFYRLTDFGSNIVTELDAAHSTHANQATNQPGSQQNHQPAKQPTTQPTPASNRLFGVWCLLSAVVCLLSI